MLSYSFVSYPESIPFGQGCQCIARKFLKGVDEQTVDCNRYARKTCSVENGYSSNSEIPQSLGIQSHCNRSGQQCYVEGVGESKIEVAAGKEEYI